MKIVIDGSDFVGDPPDTVKNLIAVLDENVLNPNFERYGGGFIRRYGRGRWRVLGNFLRLSHVFDVRGTTAETKALRAAVLLAQNNPEYVRILADARARWAAAKTSEDSGRKARRAR